MKKSILLVPLFALATLANAQCPQVLNVSTGYDQATMGLLPDGVLDDDWLLTQSIPGTTPSAYGTVITKDIAWDWVGPGNNTQPPSSNTPAKWINYHNSSSGSNNWCNDNLPVVYQNGFCICGTGTSEQAVTFNLMLHADNWAEVWILDDQGNPFVPNAILTQTHQVTTANFSDPESSSGAVTVMMAPGSYSLALLQRNDANTITGVSLDGTIVSSEVGVISWKDPACPFTPSLNGLFYGSDVGCGVYNGVDGAEAVNIITSGCQNMLIASTGYDNANPGMTIPALNADDDWVVTQVPYRSLMGYQGQAAQIIPKDVNYDWASSLSKYMSYHSDVVGLPNWYNNRTPVVYQNGFCVCGPPGLPQSIKFDLALHSDNWAEVWLVDESGASLPQLLLSQTYQQSNMSNFKNPADVANPTLSLEPGPYSLAILHRNGDQFLTNGKSATAVSLDAILTAAPGNQWGLVNSNGTHSLCDFKPSIPAGGSFDGTAVDDPPSTGGGGGGGGPSTDPWCPGCINMDPIWKMAINELENTVIYPNPSSGMFRVDFAEVGNYDYMVTTITGQVVVDITNSSNRSITIDLSNQPNGVYFLKLRNASDTEVIKLLKQD